jgi:hypothetical protein
MTSRIISKRLNDLNTRLNSIESNVRKMQLDKSNDKQHKSSDDINRLMEFVGNDDKFIQRITEEKEFIESSAPNYITSQLATAPESLYPIQSGGVSRISPFSRAQFTPFVIPTAEDEASAFVESPTLDEQTTMASATIFEPAACDENESAVADLPVVGNAFDLVFGAKGSEDDDEMQDDALGGDCFLDEGSSASDEPDIFRDLTEEEEIEFRDMAKNAKDVELPAVGLPVVGNELDPIFGTEFMESSSHPPEVEEGQTTPVPFEETTEDVELPVGNEYISGLRNTLFGVTCTKEGDFTPELNALLVRELEDIMHHLDNDDVILTTTKLRHKKSNRGVRKSNFKRKSDIVFHLNSKLQEIRGE